MDNFRRRVAESRYRQAKRNLVIASLSLVLFIFSLALGTYIAVQLSPVKRNYIYPFPYRDVVERYAAYYHVDSTLVAAVIKAESKFQGDAESHRGAIGLMQLMPSTAEWIATQLDDPTYSEEKMKEPERNIRYGVWYLHSLQQEFHGNPILILAAYNAGRGNVQEWMKEYGWGMDFHDVNSIPFAETREYVKNVMEMQKKYEELYPEE